MPNEAVNVYHYTSHIEAENKRFRKALEFYANKNLRYGAWIQDNGNIALNALKGE